ncbi:hypothetical protein LWC34_28545 [Kibdelosporangium philippinense]|uniref:Lipoprotein n=1 Tax=Kibdelosporangium philippinense TaxID=211113 RepID=A0ABS8ZLT3_9PSEU|nr:hypothetical protein [Kibdelosporangium philippinense]MCE7006747.1 hypothetical protein [Kibdelosporangium philippinense]
MHIVERRTQKRYSHMLCNSSRFGLSKWLMRTAGVALLIAAGAGCSQAGKKEAVSDSMVLSTLKDLLPPGRTSQQQGNGSRIVSPSVAGGQLTYDDGDGAAALVASVEWKPTPLLPTATACPPRAHFPYNHCTREELPSKDVLTIDRGYNDRLNVSDVERWTATLTAPDGKQVTVQEWNAATPTSSQKSRTHPPLGNQQLTELVSAKPWQRLLSSLKAPPSNLSAPNKPELPKNQIQAILEKMVPSNFSLTDQDGVTGYFSVVLDDGQGKALVTVTVQQWQPHEPNIKQLFTRADTLPDGTKRVIRKNPAPDGASGTVQWDADTLRKDGYRVLISELNTWAFGLPRSRQDPPLSPEQLSDIALDPSWVTPQ